MLASSSRASDVDVYAEIAALKRSQVSRTELSTLDVNETTIPLIQVLRGPTTSFPSWPIWRWLQSKLYDTYASDDGSLGLDGSGRSLRLALKTKKCMYFG